MKTGNGINLTNNAKKNSLPGKSYIWNDEKRNAGKADREKNQGTVNKL